MSVSCNSSSIFDKLFNPLSIGRSNDDLVDFGGSTKAQLAYFVASVVIGFFTVGIFHLSHELLHHFYWKNRTVTKSNPSEFTIVNISEKPQVIFSPSKKRAIKSLKLPIPLNTLSKLQSPTTNKPISLTPATSISCKYSQGQSFEIEGFLNNIDVSQPMIPTIDKDDSNNLVSQACALICLKAALSFLKRGAPKDEREIYQLINEGIIDYRSRSLHPQEKLIFEDLYMNLEAREKEHIKIVKPDCSTSPRMDFVDVGAFDSFCGNTLEELSIFLEAIINQALLNKGRTCVSLTIQPKNTKGTNATIVIMLDEQRHLWLFDSHGLSGSGASLRSFETVRGEKSLDDHIQKHFFKNVDGEFTSYVLNKQC